MVKVSTLVVVEPAARLPSVTELWSTTIAVELLTTVALAAPSAGVVFATVMRYVKSVVVRPDRTELSSTSPDTDAAAHAPLQLRNARNTKTARGICAKKRRIMASGLRVNCQIVKSH